MRAQDAFAKVQLPFVVDGVDLDIAMIQRSGTRAPILFLHGFGSVKVYPADSSHSSDSRHGCASLSGLRRA